MKSVKLLSVLIVLVLIASAAGCGLAAPTNAPATMYAVGETAEAAGIQITLNSYQMAEKQLHLNFTVKNNSDKEYNVSTRFTMEGFDPEGNKLVFVMFPANELGGRISSGASITGDVCLSGADSPAGVKVYYDPTAQLAYTIGWELQ